MKSFIITTVIFGITLFWSTHIFADTFNTLYMRTYFGSGPSDVYAIKTVWNTIGIEQMHNTFPQRNTHFLEIDQNAFVIDDDGVTRKVVLLKECNELF